MITIRQSATSTYEYVDTDLSQMNTTSHCIVWLIRLNGFLLFIASLLASESFADEPPANADSIQEVSPDFERPLTRQSALEDELRRRLKSMRIAPIKRPPQSPPELVRLGRFLYYDKILSGNRDTSCATCHHDLHVTGDACSLAVGTGTRGLGPLRLRGENRRFTPRNSPDIFNRGLAQWRVQFWDGRVEQTADGFRSPAKEQLPSGFTHVLQVQAMFPVTSRAEMRGDWGDRDVDGNLNEIAAIDDENFTEIWEALMKRLLGAAGSRNRNAPSYRELFRNAYPMTAENDLGFQHAAAAIAAYERSAYTLLDSPWDRFLAGESSAINSAAKRGALLFYGKARCVNCHSGPLMTDQKHHNLLIPHLGSDALNDREDDIGRSKETEQPGDKYAFRTPPLRNVAETGPWMHNGLYSDLESVIKHHLDPIRAFQNYDIRQLTMRELRPHLHNSEEDLNQRLSTLAGNLKTPLEFSESEMKDLLNFLHALTSPSLKDLNRNVPSDVPSGLPID